MTVTVVIIFKMIHIQHDQRKLRVHAASPVDLLRQYIVDQAPVPEPGQLIDVRQISQLTPRIPQLTITVSQGPGQLAQLLGDMFPFPGKGNHIAERLVCLVTDIN